MNTTGARPAPRFGPEVWATVAARDWSLWDLWFCVIAVVDHGGDLDALAAFFVEGLRAVGAIHGRDANEAKLSHVRDLGKRLAAAGLAPGDLAVDAVVADQKVMRRAREKVLASSHLEGRARSPAMTDTPRVLLSRRARYGHWAAFPSDPMRWFEKFRPTVERKDSVTAAKTFAIVERLERRLDDLDGPRRTLADRLGLYRAFHTAALELADASDDSYGNIGHARTDAWLAYLAIDWRSTGIASEAYWRDLCELLIWEPYAVDYRYEDAWFRAARATDIDVIEAILLDLEAEHRAAVLDYEADAALGAIADLYVATNARDRFTSVARRLGSRAWRPVVAMAQSQLEARSKRGAVEVFRAADRPGPQREHIRRRCLDMTGVDLAIEARDRTR